MPTPAEWFAIAQESRDSAERLLVHGAWRSSAGRAYYAVFAAAHAPLRHFGRSYPPGRQNWRHGSVSGELWGVMRQDLKMSKIQAKVFVDGVAEAYATRVNADYRPALRFDRHDAKAALGRARELVRLAGRLTQ